MKKILAITYICLINPLLASDHIQDDHQSKKPLYSKVIPNNPWISSPNFEVEALIALTDLKERGPYNPKDEKHLTRSLEMLTKRLAKRPL